MRVLNITYKKNSLERECTDISVAERAYGCSIAQKLHQRIKEIRSADSVEDLVKYGIGRCHPLEGTRDGQYGMDLVHPHRLIFKKSGEKIKIKGIEYPQTEEVRILEVKDYHGKTKRK